MSDPGRAADAHASVARPSPFPADSEPLYTVGQVADMLGVQPAFLRRLESHDVIVPQRSAGGQRRYSRDEIDHIDAITGLLDEGFTVAGAKRIIELQAEVATLRRQLAAGGPNPGPARDRHRDEPDTASGSVSPRGRRASASG